MNKNFTAISLAILAALFVAGGQYIGGILCEVLALGVVLAPKKDDA